MQVSFKNIFLLFIFSFLISDFAFTQQTPAKTDSTSIYKNIETGEDSDSVDVFIRELDRWSITPTGTVSNRKMFASITDINFLGSGHEFQNTFSRNFITGVNSFNTDYFLSLIHISEPTRQAEIS